MNYMHGYVVRGRILQITIEMNGFVSLWNNTRQKYCCPINLNM